jgi:tricorn protease-like protein
MMLKELKTFINSIPENMDEFEMVNGEFGLGSDGNTFVMTNNSIMTIYVDENNGEIQFLHQTDKDVKNILLDGDSEKN